MTGQRTVILLLVAILAAVIGFGTVLVLRGDGGPEKWSTEECIKASLTGPQYDPQGMRDHGCFG